MNKHELAKLLQAEEFAEETWSLDGQMPAFADDALLLWEEQNLWTIAFAERGQLRREFVSRSEDEACRRFYELMQLYMR